MQRRRRAQWGWLILILLLLACDRKEPVVSWGPSPDLPGRARVEPSAVLPAGSVSRRPITLGFSQLGTESDWRNANSESVKEAAAEAGIELLFENAEQSQEKQFEAIRSFVEKKVDVIAIAPVIETGWEPILREVKQAGIPVIMVDREMKISDPSLYVTFIGSDFYEEGRKAGKYLRDALRDEIGPIGIAELKGTEGSSPTIERAKGFRDIIRERSDFRIILSEHANFTVKEGKRVMEKFLREKGREIRVLFAHNDDMALGAVEAIKEYGLRPGKDILIISVDGSRKALEKLAAGEINFVVECNPLIGPQIMQAVQEIMEGRSLPKRIVSSETVFTQTSAARELPNRRY
jgi:simple sugar transport system substrate-binding protein